MADEHVTNNEVVLPLADQQGTIRDLAITNDGITSIANHRVYDSFGNLESQTNAAVDCLFGYTGRAYDNNTGLQNNLNRWYDAKVGRWASEDPKGFAAGQTNLYVYCGNSPTNATDPSGCLSPEAKALLAEYQRLQQESLRLRGLVDGDDEVVSGLINKALELAHGNVEEALRCVMEIRNQGLVPWNSDDWACVDHYLNARAGNNYFYGFGRLHDTAANAYYEYLKYIGSSWVKPDSTIPPCPSSWRQWRWGNGGTWSW
jgi:RHS repeat-associated protein